MMRLLEWAGNMWAIIINYKSVQVYLVRVLNQLYKLKQSEARRNCPHPPVSVSSQIKARGHYESYQTPQTQCQSLTC